MRELHSLVLLLILLFFLNANSQARRTNAFERSKQLAKRIESFEEPEKITNFLIEGVSLNTPLALAREILAKNGYEEVFSNQPTQIEFIKNGRHSLLPGTSNYKIILLNNGSKKELTIIRQTKIDLKISDPDLPLSSDVTLAKELKEILCKNTKDMTERWTICSPNTKKEVSLGEFGRQWLRVGDNLYIQMLQANPSNGRISILEEN